MSYKIRHATTPSLKPIRSLDISLTGSKFVVAQSSNNVEDVFLSVWDINHIRLIYDLEIGEGHINSQVRYSPDSRLLVYSDSNTTPCIFDLEKNLKIRLDANVRHVQWVDYCLSVNRFVIAGESTQVWDAVNSRMIWLAPRTANILNGMTIPIIGAISPPGTEIALAGLVPGAISIFDISNNSIVQTLEGAPEMLRWISYSSSGQYIAAIGFRSHGTILWDLKTGNHVLPETFNLNTESYWCLRFHPYRSHIALGNLNGFVKIYDLQSGEVLFRQQLHEGRVWDIGFTPDGNKLFSGGDDGVISVCIVK